MPLTQEQLDRLLDRATGPEETEYQENSVRRRMQNPRLADIWNVIKEAGAVFNPGPTFRRAGTGRGFGRGRNGR